jgi:hypothetical protein
MSKKFTSGFLACCIILLLPGFLSAQQITTFDPQSASVGSVVTITGNGFDPIPGNNIVYFGATKAVVVSASTSQLAVTVPVGATYQPITVTTGGLTAYSAKYFNPLFGCPPLNFSTSMLGNKVNFSSGYYSSPTSIVIADFDGDGKPDIAVTDQDNNSITVFRNTGASPMISNTSFTAGVNFYSAGGPIGIVVGDIDGDGKPDIAVTNNTSSISIFRNTGEPGYINALTFAPQVSFPTSTGASDDAGTANIAIGDLDGDGKPDLAVTNSNSSKNTISIFRNTSTPGIINSTSLAPKVDLAGGSTPLGLVITDIDGDGNPDIAVNNGYGTNLSVYRNISTKGVIGVNSFSPAVNFTTQYGTAGITAGDLNNDGKPDLVVSNLLANSISIFQNNASKGSITSTSFFSPVNLSTPTNPVSPVISDFNGDGKPDIALTSFELTASSSVNNPLSLFVNKISGSTITSASFATRMDLVTGGSFGKIAIGDLDEDGKPDFVIPNYTSDLISVLRNNITRFTSLPPVTVNSQGAVCDDGVWKNYYDPAAINNIICSVKDNGQSLGSTNATAYIDATPANYNGNYFLPRHYVITPAAQPSTNIKLRLYFTLAEFNALQISDNKLAAPGDLSIIKYQGPTEDGVFNPGDASSLTIIPSSAIQFGSAVGGFYAEFTVSGLSEFWLGSANLALPIQLLYFNAQKQDKMVSLQWSTASEINNDHFTVERSGDGVNFLPIATINAASGLSQPGIYEAKDASPFSGINYYRLKQTDKDGKSSYSAIKTVQWSGLTVRKLTIAPHPMVTQSTVSFWAKAGRTVFLLYTIEGALLKTYPIDQQSSGNVQLNITKDKLLPGIYLYKVNTNNQPVYHGKLVVE